MKREGSAIRIARLRGKRTVLSAIAIILASSLAIGTLLRAQDARPTAGNPITKAKRLKLGKRLKVKLRGGQSRSYAIHAEAGQFFHVVVEQKSIDLTLILLDPTGKQVARSHMPGREPISGLAEGRGEFYLQIVPQSKDAFAGMYEVRLTDLRAPTEADRTRVAAEGAYSEGQQLFNKKDFDGAAAKWEESIGLWHGLNDRDGEGGALQRLGTLYFQRQQWQKALDSYNQALPVERSAGDRAAEAATLRYMGNVYFFGIGDKERALDYYNQSIPIARAVGDSAGEAGAIRSIGAVYGYRGDMQKALSYFMQALPLEQAARDRAGEARTLSNIGQVYDMTGEKQKALDYYTHALESERTEGDNASQIATLSNLGALYSDLGDPQKALDYFTQDLVIEKAEGDRLSQAGTFVNIGLIDLGIGENQKALDYFDQALQLQRAVGNRATEATTLMNIGMVYARMGEREQVLDYYNQALAIHRSTGNRVGEASTLLNIGAEYSSIGEKQKALDYYNEVLPIAREIKNPMGEAITLHNIGAVYAVLGEMQKAIDYYNQALPIQRKIQDHASEAITLNDIGLAYADLGEKQKAIDYYNQALPIQRAVQDRAAEARTMASMGSVYSDLGEGQKALNYFEQALAIERVVGDRKTEAGTLSGMGIVYASLKEKQKALDYYSESLPLFRAVQDPLGEGRDLVLLMEYWKDLSNPNLAILFGKEAIDRFQQVRRNIGGLDQGTQQSFLKSKEDYYRELAELLISQGRLPEAQQVLDLLKAEEYSDFTQRRGNTGSDTSPVALTPMEEKSNQEYEQITTNITAIGSEWTQLRAKSSRSPDEEKRYNLLSNNLTAANLRLQTFMKGLYESFGKGDQANAKVENVREETAGLQNLLAELGGGTTAVYTLVTDHKLVEMVITPGVQVAREVTISKTELRAKVFAFTHSLGEHDSEDDIRAKAQDLYSILIAPIEKDLQGAQARTLVWSLDDVLRYVPLAALYDGKQYLVERYQNVVITTASAGNLKDQPQVSNWRGAAMGVSKDYDGLGQLKAVPGELDAVVHSDTTAGSHGPVPGVILLDDLFTETQMESELEHHPPLVHIASHYVFQPGDDTKSYLLLGGKETGGEGFHLTLAELRDEQKMDFKGIELLTLSGCQTAVGSNDSDGREIDGLGITAQRKGAKAVVATLWPVDDASVGLLMATFYKLWVTTPGMTKVEALQQAQIEVMRGTADSSGTSRGINKAGSPASTTMPNSSSPYANPFYWAPFILIGNWK